MAENDVQAVKDATENTNENQTSQDGKKNKSMIDYKLIPAVGGCIFNIYKQHPNVARFLNSRPGGVWRDPINGVAITLSYNHPEFIMSGKGGLGITIRLDGTEGCKAIERGHTDITRFPVDTNVYRDGAMNMFNNAMERFGQAVKNHFAYEDVQVLKQDKFKTISV